MIIYFGNTLIDDRTLSLSSVSDGTLILERSQFCESELLINTCGGII